MPTINVRLSPALHERLIAECEKHKLTISDVLRQSVETWLGMAEKRETPWIMQPQHLGHHGPKPRDAVDQVAARSKANQDAYSRLVKPDKRTK